MGALEEGMDIHQRVLKNGFASNFIILNDLIYMHYKIYKIIMLKFVLKALGKYN